VARSPEPAKSDRSDTLTPANDRNNLVFEMPFHDVERGARTAATSIDKALEVCEALSRAPRGSSVAELSRALGLPAPTVHRLLAVLKRRGYVRQDEETQRYGLTLKMLDLSFRFLGRSEIRLHAYPVLREYVLRSGLRAFLAIPDADEVTYIWATGPDEVAMRTVYGREMPAHCAVYFSVTQATRRLNCLRLDRASDVAHGAAAMRRLGPPVVDGATPPLGCTCAPVMDYSGREVARLGAFTHEANETPLVTDVNRACWELARQVSRRLGFLPPTSMDIPA
jgi:DNA-binding transcriptional ArsR family regulator